MHKLGGRQWVPHLQETEEVHFLGDAQNVYRAFAQPLGLAPSYRRAQLWRDIKAHIQGLAYGKQRLPVWIIDEAQNLPAAFFRDFPSFLSFAFDSRDFMMVWLVGHPPLAQLLERAPYAALATRLCARVQMHPVLEGERFAKLIHHGLPPPALSTR